ncbi:uncharacterized protein ACLA_090830 [Aspergillus clavatus NRRL 1]|uniref:DUF7492 domain-containing protein n=1 Tax=Aspergillus clavatus (strain ATCC 1007 / CBS 513.65 / DSM 816 / NCTC 3887 / NRRL 1 / QM 1276 / 107) TaxID=344612 RepID=A1CEU1_ASPCL|nr:uncharacterized protein ACLA_090830 [Aspergillus clavatus NRRL 1]EAW11390.1 conserved hypothetical protein [Aspergillus clavatus NRRL 1]
MKAMHVLWMDALSLLLLTLFVVPISAHSWVEQLTVIAPNGTFVGSPGFPRGNVLRSDPAFNDNTMTYLTPPNGRANLSQILPSDKLCKDTQRKQVQTEGSPRLQASPGAAIALRFQENGHVTLPQNQLGKPPNCGTVYVYGTTEPKEDEKLLDVHKVWNKEGTGGDKRGVLLSEQNFDDGRCYQINSGQISQHRQSTYPHEANQLMGADLWCQQDTALPSKVPIGKLYTLYWVWDWPTAPGVDPGLPNGKQEIYTTCMDVDMVDRPLSHVRVPASYVDDQSLNNAAIPSQFEEIFGQGSSPSSSLINDTKSCSNRASDGDGDLFHNRGDDSISEPGGLRIYSRIRADSLHPRSFHVEPIHHKFFYHKLFYHKLFYHKLFYHKSFYHKLLHHRGKDCISDSGGIRVPSRIHSNFVPSRGFHIEPIHHKFFYRKPLNLKLFHSKLLHTEIRQASSKVVGS